MEAISSYLWEILDKIKELTQDVPCPSYSLIALVAGLAYLLYYRRSYNVWRNQGIPGPTPWPIVGNTMILITKGFIDGDLSILKKYGKTAGIYEWGSPKLLTSDEDIMREVMVKDFGNYMNRLTARSAKLFEHDEIFHTMMTNIRDDEWKRVRSMLTPTFSTRKLKLMTHAINECASILVERLGEQADKDEEFEAKEYSGNTSMDILARTAFGLQVNSHQEKDSIFVRMGKRVIKPRMWLILLLLIPGGKYIMKKLKLSFMEPESTKFFTDVVEQTLEGRTSGDKSRLDFIQLMTNAHRDEYDVAEVAKEVAEDGIVLDQSNKPQKSLSKIEILAQGFVFFLGGYDTVSNALSLFFYNMAHHPECQQRAQQELDDVIGHKDELQYSDIQSLPYLDQCLQESMRIFTPGPRLERAVSRDVTVKGIHLKKNTMVCVAVHARHMDPAIWPDPEKYDPDRFLPEERARHSPYDHMPFGFGPRNCIAMRLALMELKMIAAYVLKHFTLLMSEKTQIPLKLDGFTLAAKNGVWLKAQRRV